MPTPLPTNATLSVALASALERGDLAEFRLAVEQSGRAAALKHASARLEPWLVTTARRTLQRHDWLGAESVGDMLIRLHTQRQKLSPFERDDFERAREALQQAVIDLVLVEPVGERPGDPPPTTTTIDITRPDAPPPIGQPEGLQAWARQHGVEPRLDEDLYSFVAGRGVDGNTARALRPLRGQAAVRDALVSHTQGANLLAYQFRKRSDLPYVQQFVAAELNTVAWERYAGAARGQSRARTIAASTSHPALRQLAAALALQLGTVERAGELPSTSQKVRVEFDRQRLALVVYSKPSRVTELSTTFVRVMLDGYPAAPPRLWCQCGRVECDSIALALDRLIEWLLSPRGPSAELIEELQIPPWRRALAALNATAKPSAQPSAVNPAPSAAETPQPLPRLRFRLYHGDDIVLLEPILQRWLASGRWSSGTRLSRDRMRRLKLTGPQAPAMRRALRTLGSVAPGEERQALAEALEALAGTDRVYFLGGTAPVAIRTGPLGLVARESDGGGVRLLPAVGEHDMPWAAVRRLEAGTPLVHLDEARNVCLLAEVSDDKLVPLRALAAFPGQFPHEALPELWACLHRIQGSLPLHLPPEVLGALVEPDGRVVVRIQFAAEGIGGVLRIRPIAGGYAYAPGEGPSRLTGTLDAMRVYTDRHLEEERPAAEAVWSALGLDDLPAAETEAVEVLDEWSFSVVNDDAALDLLARLQALPEVVVEWAASEERRVLGSVGLAELKLTVSDRPQARTRTDWFGVDGGVELEGHHIALADLLDAVRAGRRYVKVEGGGWVAMEEQLRDRLRAAADVTYRGRAGLEASWAAAPALASIAEGAGQAQLGSTFAALVAKFRSAPSQSAEPPAELAGILRPYQVEGFQWLMQLAHWGAGGCLADDMGLGKTLQALAVLAARASLGPALVVAPTSVCWNWASEAARFVPSLRVVRYHDADRDAVLEKLGPGDLLIASYGLVLRHTEALAARPFATLILDEAQAIKNARTRRAQAVRELSADCRIALSGTPVENHLGELWSLLQVVAPGLLGSGQHFRERFSVPIEQDHDPERSKALARIVRPFLLRRTKAEVAPELPPRTDVRRLVALSPPEREHYDSVRLAMVAQLQRAASSKKGAGPEQQRFAILAAITRLRLLACHPRLLDDTSTLPSAKLEAFCELADELREGGHRALVFSQFTSHLALVAAALRARKASFLQLDGQTPEADRRARVQRFQGGEGEMFLISLRAGGTGLNLTGADYVVHLDPWWNPAVEDQATDRAHRIGQQKPVTVYRLVSQGTIEETILSLHQRKRELAAALLDGTDTAGRLSPRELLDLIRESSAGATAEAAAAEADKDEE